MLASMRSDDALNDEVLNQAWAALVQLFIARRDTFITMSRGLGLTPPQTHALMSLAGGPVRMRSMADTLVCDASYVTSIVDRLEELGLAERQPSSVDRRVKEVALTTTGQKALNQLQQALYEPPDALRLLSDKDQRDLARIARHLAPTDELSSPFGLR
jgi:DNA-binding MarR family transcriptional regulator